MICLYRKLCWVKKFFLYDIKNCVLKKMIYVHIFLLISTSYRKIFFTQHNFQYFINLLYFLIGKMKLQSVRSRDWGLRTWVSGRPLLVFENIIFFRENARLKWDIWESQKNLLNYFLFHVVVSNFCHTNNIPYNCTTTLFFIGQHIF